MTKADDGGIEALRDEIRGAVRNTRRWRLGVGFVALLPAASVAVLVVISLRPGSRAYFFQVVRRADGFPVFSPPGLIPYWVWLLGIGLLASVACAVALAVTATYRSSRRNQVRHRLARLGREDIVRVLAPLTGGARSGDARKIIAPLLRYFGVRREVTPATSLAARGDEPSPAETPP